MLKKIFYRLTIITAVISGIVFLGIYCIEKSSLQGFVISKIEQSFGHNITIESPIKLNILPTPQILLGQVSLKPRGQPLSIGPYHLSTAKVKTLALSWSWLSLLRGKIHFNYLTLREPEIVLFANYTEEFKGVTVDKSQETLPIKLGENSPKNPQLPAENRPKPSTDFIFNNISIESGRVTIKRMMGDGKASDEINLTNINLCGFMGSFVENLTGPALRESVKITGGLHYQQYKLAVNLSVGDQQGDYNFAGNIVIDCQQKSALPVYLPLHFKGLLRKASLRDSEFKLNTEGTGITLPFYGIPLSFKGEISKNLNNINAKYYLKSGAESLVIESKTNMDSWVTKAKITSPKLSYPHLDYPELNASNYFITNLKATLNINSKDDLLADIKADLYGGDLQGQIVYQNKNNRASLGIDFQGQGLDLQKINLSTTFGPNFGIESGKLTAKIKGMINLNNLDNHLETINGFGNLSITDAKIKTFDVTSLLSQLRDFNLIEQLTKGINLPKTKSILKVDKIHSDFIIAQGKLKTDNFAANTDVANINAKGSINLVNQLLDINLNVFLKPIGITLPLSITGNLTNPNYNFSYQQLLSSIRKNLGKGLINNAVEEVKQTKIDPKKIINREVISNLIGNIFN